MLNDRSETLEFNIRRYKLSKKSTSGKLHNH